MPEIIARALPQGSAIILRDDGDPRRRARAWRLRRIAENRGALFFVAADAGLAEEVGADGVHLRAAALSGPRPPVRFLVSAACHSAAELDAAARLGADAAFLSPVFPTESHPGAPALGAAAFRALAARAGLPVLALGGVDPGNAASLAARNVAGFGAIGGFAL